MPQPVSYNPGTPVSGSIQENSISYVVDGQNRNYRGGFGGLSWMSEVPAANNVIFIGNSVSLGRGPANIPLFYPSYNNSAANIIYAANTLPGSPRNFTTTGSAYNWAATNNFFINNSDNPIPRINGDSLGLYIDANQPTSYPQTGTTWYDLSGIGNNCGLYNGPTWNSNGYIQFDGTDDFVGVGNTGVTKLNQNYQTLRFLIYITSVGPNGYSELYAVTNANRTGIKWETAGIGMDANGDFYNVFVNVSNAYNQWMDISCVIDRVGNIFKVYKNGTYIGQDTFTPYTANSTDITIGANRLTGNGGDYIKGNISEVSVYGKELSLSEIKQNYFQGNIVTGSLVLMVDANNLVSYPKSGTSTYSLTGSITGTLTNGVSFNSRNGGVFDFDGTDDTISIPYNTAMDPTGGITLEAWIYPEDLTTVGYQEIFRKESGAGRQLFSFQINGTIISFGTDTTGNGYDELDIAITPSNYINRWCHFVATYTSGYKAIYVDGQLLGSNTGVTGNLIQGNAPYYIGSSQGAGEFFNGYYASFKMYSKGLSATEVQQNYQATKDKFLGQNIATNGLVLNLDAANKDSYPGTGTTWTNLSGGGYNGTLINGPIFLSNQNGGIFSFDGVDDYIQYASLLNVGNTFTINCWIKPTVNTRQTIVSNGYPYSTNKGFFMTCPGNNPTDLFISLGQDQKLAVSGTGMITTGAWQMVTARVNGASELIKLYVNGVETTYSSQTDANITLQYDTGVFTTGCRNGVAADDRLYSNFATLQIYNRALSATEIQQNYNAQKIRFGL